jgi:hypothetical protein
MFLITRRWIWHPHPVRRRLGSHWACLRTILMSLLADDFNKTTLNNKTKFKLNLPVFYYFSSLLFFSSLFLFCFILLSSLDICEFSFPLTQPAECPCYLNKPTRAGSSCSASPPTATPVSFAICTAIAQG